MRRSIPFTAALVAANLSAAQGLVLRAQEAADTSGTHDGSQVASATDSSAAEQAPVSQVRIVRLSEVHGAVQMDRSTGRGYEAAFTNIPVTAGARLRTGEGVAEVEFEDNSSLRLLAGSEVQFSRLGRGATGETLTTLDVRKGTVYVSLQKGKSGDFAVLDATSRMDLNPGTHLRFTAAEGPQAELAVFDGSVQMHTGAAQLTLLKKQSVMFNPAGDTVSAVQHGIAASDWDEWDKREAEFHKVQGGLASVGGLGLYGSNDLGYYGNFADLPGCGSVWRPYFASAAWDPFGNGTWALYPGAGYSWVSPYPWGWLPYHSGSWVNCGASGWGWRPGGAWRGLENRSLLQRPMVSGERPQPGPPLRHGPTLVPVNTRTLLPSGIRDEQTFLFRQDSAGLGVPRSGFGNLHGIAGNVAHSGAISRGLPAGFAPVAMNPGGRGAPPQGTPAQTAGANGGMRPSGTAGRAAPQPVFRQPAPMGSSGGNMRAPSASPSSGAGRAVPAASGHR